MDKWAAGQFRLLASPVEDGLLREQGKFFLVQGIEYFEMHGIEFADVPQGKVHPLQWFARRISKGNGHHAEEDFCWCLFAPGFHGWRQGVAVRTPVAKKFDEFCFAFGRFSGGWFFENPVINAGDRGWRNAARARCCRRRSLLFSATSQACQQGGCRAACSQKQSEITAIHGRFWHDILILCVLATP